MSVVGIFNRNPSSPVFQGAHDEKLLERSAALERIYDGGFEFSRVACEHDGHDFNVATYLWRASPETGAQKRSLIIILNGIYTTARSNDHTAKTMSEEYGHDVLCVDFPGKGKSEVLPTKDNYSPEMYAALFRDVMEHYSAQYDEIHAVGYSHGARVIFDLYEQGWNPKYLKSVTLGDMGPERPADAAIRRYNRNQHNATYGSLTEATQKLTKFFAGHGFSLPEDFVLNVINRNFNLMDDGERATLQFGYDPRSMFGYVDEMRVNPSMECWAGFHKIDVPTFFWRGTDSNTVDPVLLKDMVALKKGSKTLGEIYAGRKLEIDFAHATAGTRKAPFYVLDFEGTGHYPEPHRVSHYAMLGAFLRDPVGFHVGDALRDVSHSGQYKIPRDTLKHAGRHTGLLPMPGRVRDIDMLPFLSKKRIVPLLK